MLHCTWNMHNFIIHGIYTYILYCTCLSIKICIECNDTLYMEYVYLQYTWNTYIVL